ncbi:MAG: hypothetical protein AAB535_01890 [Patescibacteria group bacterium]
MSNKRKDYRLYLVDIETSCSKILKYSKNKTKTQWETVKKDIPALRKQIAEILKNPQLDLV